MVHQPSGGFQGQATDIMIHAEEILKLKRVVNRLYVKHTGQTIEEIGKKKTEMFAFLGNDALNSRKITRT